MKLTNLLYCFSLSLALFSCQNETEEHACASEDTHSCASESKKGDPHAACDTEEKHSCGSESKKGGCESEASACGGHDDHGHGEGNDSPNFELTKEQASLLDIKSEAVEKQSVGTTLNLTGHIATPPESFASVYAPLGGFVSWSVLLPGDYVKKGAVLAEIEDPKYIELQEQFLKSEAELEFWKKQWQRQEALKAQDLLSQKQFDEQLLAIQKAEIEHSSLKNQLILLGLSPKRLTQKGIQRRLKITSPISGYITKSDAHLNKYVQQHELMFSLVDKSSLHAEIQIFTKDLKHLKKEQEFYFSTTSSDDVLKGKVALIGELVDAESKTIDIHGEILSSTQDLKPGMFIRAEVPTTKNTGFVVKNSSIFEQEKVFYVLISKGNNHFEAIEIEKGSANSNFTEIRNPNEKLLEFPVVVSSVFELQSAWLKQKGALGSAGCQH